MKKEKAKLQGPIIVEPIDLDIDDEFQDMEVVPSKFSKQQKSNEKGVVYLAVDDNSRGMRKSSSIASITSKVRARAIQLRNNQLAGIIFFFWLGLLCSICSYLTSVWSAELNKELIEAAVRNEQTLRFKLGKSLVEGPSKYLIGLLNFGGRILSAIGTVMLVQVVVAYVKRRRYNLVLRSAAGEADQVVEGVHTGITDAAGECIMNCLQVTSTNSVSTFIELKMRLETWINDTETLLSITFQ